MSYLSSEILVDRNGKPIPQIFDEVLGEFIPVTNETIQSTKIVGGLENHKVSVKNLPDIQKVSGSVSVGNIPKDYPDKAVKSELEALKTLQQSVSKAINDLNIKLDTTNNRLNEELSVRGEVNLASSDVDFNEGRSMTNVQVSTTTKPEGKMGDSLYEWDTEKLFLHDGKEWREL